MQHVRLEVVDRMLIVDGCDSLGQSAGVESSRESREAFIVGEGRVGCGRGRYWKKRVR